MIFASKEGKIEYINSKLYEFDASWKYLYQRDYSGKPGLFLTGNLPRNDTEKLSYDNTKFIKRKIMWFPHGKLVNNTDLFQTLSDDRQKELGGIFKELEHRHEQISSDVINILTHSDPEQTWLTIMLEDEEKPKFVGQIQDYVDFFNKGLIFGKGNKEELVCNVCNKSCLVYPYTERPLPFFYSDKIHFFHNGNITRSFPVCESCYKQLQDGIKFVDTRLNYHISSSKLLQGKEKSRLNKPDIRFWLIPFINDYEILEMFKDELDSRKKQLYYLESLKELCSSLKSIQTYDFEERQEYTDAFLKFSALFYYKDNKAAGLMRVLSYTPEIYPSQLRKLLIVKEKIENRYPYQHIKKEVFFVGLPLLVTFYKEISPQWQVQIIAILSKMFTGQQISTDQIIRNVNLRIHEAIRYSRDLQIISRIALMGLMLLEYLITLNNDNSDNKQVINESQILMSNISTLYEISNTEKFIQNHKSVLSNETKKGVFAAGVSVAILLHVQENKYKKTAPFWDKLSRLDLNLQKVLSLIPEVKRLLGAYKIRSHDTIINYLAAQYVIDPSESKSIPKDLASYIFTLGLSFGYLLARKNLIDDKKEEVND
jgi:CRISPR-associated protein Cas8b/Csh1 subtype I-B